jgi:hypothetical protein
LEKHTQSETSLQVGVVHKVGNEKRTQLWNNVWIKSAPLRICFPIIFAICDDRNIYVAKCAKSNWEIHFRRMLGDDEFSEWTKMQDILKGVTLSDRD